MLNIFITQDVIIVDCKSNSVYMISNALDCYIFLHASNILLPNLKIMRYGAFVRYTSRMCIYVKRVSNISIFTVCYIK